MLTVFVLCNMFARTVIAGVGREGREGVKEGCEG